MFSGYAFTIVLCPLFLWVYRDKSYFHNNYNIMSKIILIILTIFGVITLPCISMSKLHYTSDVVIGTSVAILLFLSRKEFALKLNYSIFI
jgi:hypothetical protein